MNTFRHLNIENFLLIINSIFFFCGLIIVDNNLPVLMNPSRYIGYLGLTLISLFTLIWLIYKRKFTFDKVDTLLYVFILYLLTTNHLKDNLTNQNPFIILSTSMIFINLRQLATLSIFPSLFLTTLFLYTIFECIIGGIQYIHLDNINSFITGTFYNQGPYAIFLSIVFPLASGCVLFKSKNKLLLYLGGVCSILILLILPTTFSRTATISIFASTLTLLTYKYINNLNRFVKKRKITSVFLFVIMFSLSIFGFVSMYKAKLDSANGRLLIWENTISVIKEHPYTGCGIDKFRSNYINAQKEYFEQGFANDNEKQIADTPEFAFNEYIELICQVGIMGFIMLAIILYLNLKNCFVSFNPSYLASLIAVLVACMFSYPLHVMPIMLVILLLLSLMSQKYVNINIKINTIITIAFITISSITYFRYIEETLKYKQYNKAKRYIGLMNKSEISNMYSNYEYYLMNNSYFLLDYGDFLYSRGEYSKCFDVFSKIQLFTYSLDIDYRICEAISKIKPYKEIEEFYWNVHFKVPNRFIPLYNIMNLYINNDEINKAINVSKIIIDKHIKIESNIINNIKEKANQYYIKNIDKR